VKVYDYLTDAFVAEHVDTVFGVMGDSNMYWMTAMAARGGVSVIHSRHEFGAVLMADGYARTSGKVGVCSVTCGPGVTHATTALTAAVRRRSPLVVYTGDAPAGQARHPQAFPLGQLISLVGAEQVVVDSEAELDDAVPHAFYLAKTRRCPVVLLVAPELQLRDAPKPHAGIKSEDLVVRLPPLLPDPEAIAALAGRLSDSQQPVILAGAGAIECREALVELSERTGAYLATTLNAKGLFDDDPANLGVSGGYATPSAREILAQADVVVAFGASLHFHTTDRGRLFTAAAVTQVDVEPSMFEDGRRLADDVIRADAGLAVEALLATLNGRSRTRREAPISDTPISRDRVLDPMTGVVDAQLAVRRIDLAVPKDWHVVVGSGHFSSVVLTSLRGRHPSRIHTTYNFGAIGQALATGLGIAESLEGEPVVIIEGDGGLMQSVQELETLSRYQWPVLIFAMNDRAYAAEYHKLLVEGLDPGTSIFGGPDLAAVATGLGVDARAIRSLDDVDDVVAAFNNDKRPLVADVALDPRVPSEYYRRLYYA
jgi:acetolactate synthase I/II/III large subunit